MPKKDLHPKWYPDAIVKVNGEVVMTVGSTQPELNVDIWSGTHPFFTGQQRLVDTEGQVDRFMRRLQKREDYLTSQAKKEEEQVTIEPTEIMIADLSLAERAKTALSGEGINNVGDLLTRYQDGGDDSLLSIVGVGQKALIDIKKYLRGEGLIE